MRRPLLPLEVLAPVVLALCLVHCGEDRVRDVLPPGMRADIFQQTAAQRIDVLWVVDNSGSMAPHQENLGRNFHAFIGEFVKSAVDFRIGITTTDIFKDAGRFRGAVLTPQTPGLAQLFAQNIRVGTQGSAYEAGLEAARLALELQRTGNTPAYEAIASCQAGCPAGKEALACRSRCVADHPVEFLRPDAFLYIVFVTDEEDKSSHDVRGYYRQLMTAKGVGNDGMVTTAAIIGDHPKPRCSNANAGTRYKQLSDLTGGEVGSICDADFASTLKRLAGNAVGLQRKFALEVEPEVDSLEVTVRFRCDAPASMTERCTAVDDSGCRASAATAETYGKVCTPPRGAPDGWVYEEAARLVFFAGESVPNVPSQVELTYYDKGKRP